MRINSRFWNRLTALVRDVVIPYQWEALNDRVPGAPPSGCIRNFRIAAGKETGAFTGFVFQDSDLYKWLETASLALASRPDGELAALVDQAVNLIADAQEPDGYINTYFQINAPQSRWRNLREAHELYCAGHLIEAAAASNNGKLLGIAVKFADLIGSVFGDGDGKRAGYPGHEEIELALIKLCGAANEPRYLKLAQYFLEARGTEPCVFETERSHPDFLPIWDKSGNPVDLSYTQCETQPKNQRDAHGHAVRAMYLYSAMADAARLTGDAELKNACLRLYENITERRMYVTGAVGSTVRGEAFTGDYDLPPDSAYGETCASVGLMMFCDRLYKLTGEARFLDTAELALYNTVLAGMSLTGREFFYVNPLSVHPGTDVKNPDFAHVKSTRRKWFDCACCPPNLARTVLSLGDYACGKTEDGFTIKFFVSGEITDGSRRVTVETGYPYDGKVTVTATGGDFEIRLRNPSFAPIIGCSEDFLVLRRDWNGQTAEIQLDLRPELLFSHPEAHHTRGKAALRVGPLVYCAESADNTSSPGFYRVNSANAAFTAFTPKGLPDGTIGYGVPASRLEYDETGKLYTAAAPREVTDELRLIPYHLWANRGEGDMSVWFNITP
ncbi:hypothetical protein FACS18949_03960 [Clostridia bacterium]|nr:hypothetical protein FACS18949_03960 [Clostridia bacterium]